MTCIVSCLTFFSFDVLTLYSCPFQVCPTSVDAIQGAIGTVCEAVDAVVNNTLQQSCKRAFVSIRPPGHHCGEDKPEGFCFVNNVAIAAAHGKFGPDSIMTDITEHFLSTTAHLQHGIQRVVILDIDLHHGEAFRTAAFCF